MNAESVKKFDITVIDNIPEGTTTEHTISATHVEIVDGNLCFYNGRVNGRIFKQRKLVAAYAAGIWTSFEEYEDEAELGPESPVFDEESWNKFVAEAGKRGKDGSIAGG